MSTAYKGKKYFLNQFYADDLKLYCPLNDSISYLFVEVYPRVQMFQRAAPDAFILAILFKFSFFNLILHYFMLENALITTHA